MNTLCSAENITILNKEGTPTENISFEIHEGHILGLIDKDGNAARLLQAIGGIYEVSEGQIICCHQRAASPQRFSMCLTILYAIPISLWRIS